MGEMMTKNEKQLKLIQLLENVRAIAKNCPAFDEEVYANRYDWAKWQNYDDAWGADSICITQYVDEALELLGGKKTKG